MKKIILCLLTILLSVFISCSSNSDQENINNFANTSWNYKSENYSHSLKEYKNTDNKSFLGDMLEICPDLKYSIIKDETSEKTDTIDLCKKMGHDNHVESSLSFNENSCTFKEKIWRDLQIVKCSSTEKQYKFVGGNYIGYYGNSYIGVYVESYGIYIATTSTTSGKALKLPLDGNYTYDMKKIVYDSSENKQTISNDTYDSSYQYEDNNFSFTNGTTYWNGILKDNGNSIDLYMKKPENKLLYTLTK